MREIKTIKVNNKIFISIFFILLYFTVSGFFFDKVTVDLDTEKTIVYQNESADVVVKAFEDKRRKKITVIIIFYYMERSYQNQMIIKNLLLEKNQEKRI